MSNISASVLHLEFFCSNISDTLFSVLYGRERVIRFALKRRTVLFWSNITSSEYKRKKCLPKLTQKAKYNSTRWFRKVRWHQQSSKRNVIYNFQEMGKVKAWKSKKIGLPVTEFLDWTKTVVLKRELEHLHQTVSDNTTVHKCVLFGKSKCCATHNGWCQYIT